MTRSGTVPGAVRVFSNSAMTLDGKIAPREGGPVALGSPEDRRVMARLRASADAVLVGGRTFRDWPMPLVEDRRRGHPRRPRPLVNAVLTRSGAAPRKGRFFTDPRVRPVILGGPGAWLDGFPPHVDIHRAPTEPTVAWVVDLLSRVYGVRSLLVEGGGDLIFQFLAADLLDELYVTLCPKILGGREAPTLADGRGFSVRQQRDLDLVSVRRTGDELFLHYRCQRLPPDEWMDPVLSG